MADQPPADDPAGLDVAAQQLYAAAPEDFVVTRTSLAKQARADKDRPLATAIQALRRPTRSAWLINLLAREAGDALAALLDIGAALRQAQEQLAADDLRSLSQDRRRAVDALLRRAVSLGAEHGYEAPESARQEVSQTLQAALADPAATEQAATRAQHDARSARREADQAESVRAAAAERLAK